MDSHLARPAPDSITVSQFAAVAIGLKVYAARISADVSGCPEIAADAGVCVAHQGPRHWRFSTAFIDMFGSVPKTLHPYLVSFRHALVDLPRIHDDALSADIRLGAHLKALKYARRKDLAERIRVILLPELEDMDIDRILRYIDRGPIFVSHDALKAALGNLDPSRREKIMGHFSQKFEAVGEARGRAQGRAQGRAESLLRLLEKRFGTVSSRLRERIAAADVAALEAWFDRALDVHDLSSVFESSEIA